MANNPLFVGRREELRSFDGFLRSDTGEAILVVGAPGMGKTLLVNRMAKCARNHPVLQCGAVRYEVTPNDTVDMTMSIMMDDAFDAAGVKEKSLDATPRKLRQWRALLNVVNIGDLVLSLRRDPQRNTRDQFSERLGLISNRLPTDGRAVFIVDPEKYMHPRSADDWRLVIRDLPPKIKFLFAQRPDDVLITNSDFMAFKNVRRVPNKILDVLDVQEVEDLIQSRASEMSVPIDQVREAMSSYNGHPYAIQAALDVLADGRAISELPQDPTPERIAQTQWRQVCDKHGEKAMSLLRALAILEVAVPQDVMEAVAGLKSIEWQKLLANDFIVGLVREEAAGRRIYHSLLADHVREGLTDDEAKAYHGRAIDVYRRRLSADHMPDALAAARLPGHVLSAEGQEAFVSAFISECSHFLLTLGLLDSHEALSMRALDLVRAGTANEAALLGNLGRTYSMRCNLDRAEEVVHKSLAIEEKLGRLEGVATQSGNLGVIYSTRGDLDGAEKMHLRALEIDMKLGRLEGLANHYGNLGLIHRQRGDTHQAEQMYLKALDVCGELGSLEHILAITSSLGVVYQMCGNLEEAEQTIRNSLEISETLGWQEHIAKNLSSLGSIYRAGGDLGRSENMHRKSLGIAEELGMRSIAANNYGNLGLIYRIRGELGQSETMHRKSLAINEKLGTLEGIANQCANLGLIYELNGDSARARTVGVKARDSYQKIGMLDEVAQLQSWLNELP